MKRKREFLDFISLANKNVNEYIFNKYKEQELEKVNEYYMNNQIVATNKLLEDNNIYLEDEERREKESQREYER